MGWEIDPRAGDHLQRRRRRRSPSVLRVDHRRRASRVVITPPVYHPFFALVERGRAASWPRCRCAAAASSISRRSSGAFAGGARGADPLQPPQPDRRRADAASELARSPTLAAAPRRLGPRRRDPRAARPPGAEHVPFLTVSEAAAERGIALCLGLEDVQPRRPRLRSDRHRLRARPRGGRAASVRRPPLRPPRRDRLRGRLPRRATTGSTSVLAVLDHNRGLLGELARRAAARGRLRAAARPATWPGSTCARSSSATTPRRRSSSAAASRSAPGPSFGRGRERASRGSTSAPRRRWSTEAVERIARALAVDD